MIPIAQVRSALAADTRLAILRQSNLLDTPPEEAFDRLSRLASRLLDAPIALVTLVDAERQFFKSAIGLPEPYATLQETPLSHSFCKYVVTTGTSLIVTDAATDPRVSGTPAIRDLGFAAYLGFPLALEDGTVLGTFCVADTQPREWSEGQIATLCDLAQSVLTEIDLRLTARKVEAQARAVAEEHDLYAQLVRDVDAVVWEADPRTWVFTFVSQRAETLFGYPLSRWLEDSGFWASLIHPEDREQAVRTCSTATAQGRDHEFEYRMITADGKVLWIRDMVRVILNDTGEAVRLRGVLVDITAHKHAQEQVEHVVSSALCLLWQAHVEDRGDHLHWDLSVLDECAAQRFLPLRLAPGESYGCAWLASRHPSDVPRLAATSAKAIRAGLPRYTQEYRCKRAGGEIRWLFEDVLVEPLGAGRWRMVGVCSDITERKRAEAALNERERRFRSLIESSSDIITVLEADGTIVYESPSIQRLLGYAPSELVGERASGLLHRDDLDAFQARFEQAMEASSKAPVVSPPLRFRTQGGEWRWLESVFTNSLRDPVVQGVVVNSRDVSERVAMEAVLHEQEAQYRRIVETASEGIWSCDAGGRTTYVNAQMARILGYQPDELIGRQVDDFLPADAQAELALSRERRKRGGTDRFDARCLRKDGKEVWLQVSATLIRDADGETQGSLALLTDVTDRKRDEAQLRYLTTHAHCILWFAEITDRDGGGLEWRIELPDLASAQRFFPVDLSPGRDYFSVWFHSRLEPDRDESNEFANAKTRAGQGFSQQYRCRDATGAVRWLHEDVQIEVLGPRRWRAVGVTTDVTLQKHTEAELRAGEARFRAIFDEAGIGIALVDLSGRPVESNRALQNWLGYTDAELAGMDFLEFTHPDDVSLDWGHIREMLAGERDSYRVEKRYLRKDGRLVWGSLTVSAVRDQDRTPLFLVAMLEDVTAQRRTEERNSALQALGERLNVATSPKAAAQIVLDVADQLLRWDCCWVELVDAERRQGSGVISMDLIGGVRTEVDTILEEGKPSPFTLRAIDEGAILELRSPQSLPSADDPDSVFFGDVSRPSASIICVPIRNGTRVIGALSIQSYEFDAYDVADMDILQALADYCAGAFERTQAESAREELQQKLVQAQKMEAVGRLAGGVAHDFNNMLAVINGYSEILLNRPDMPIASRGPLEEVRRAGQRAAALTRQLLAFSRKEIIQPRVMDLGEVVVDIQTMLRRLIGEDIELVMRPSVEPELVKADPGQVEQVVMNLVLNARDAMPHGGRLSMSVNCAYLRDLRARDGEDVPAGHYVCLTVSDTGCGMSEDTIAHIFEPFFTTKPVGQGTGLGLATVHGIVKQNHGHIEVESCLERGTTFRVYLPRLGAPASQPDPDPEPTPTMPAGKGTILVVEDEEMLRRLVANLLESNGYHLLTAHSAEDALRRCQEHPGRIDLLLTDIVMPGKSGRELAALAAERYPELKVIYMSGYMDDDVVRRGVSAAEVHFLQKPFTLAHLAQMVRDVLGEPELPT